MSDTNIISEAQNTVNKYNQSLKDEQIAYQDSIDMSKVNDKNAYVLEGEGTESNPYLIDSIEDLVLFAYEVNNGKTYEGKYVKLNRDLDFNSNDSYEKPNRTNYDVYGYDGNFKETITTGKGFIPIGILKEESSDIGFAGIFDGNGKIISNMKINIEDSEYVDYGLFGANKGVIKKVGLKNVAINVKNKTCGGICGYNLGEIDSCWTSGVISGGLRVGGIAGAGKKGVIKNCYNSANISVELNSSRNCTVGGILGATNTVVVENCYNSGNVSGTNTGGKAIIGGIVGYTLVVIKNSYNVGKVISSGPYVGGIVAYEQSNLENVCTIGEIIYSGQSTKYVGTLVGAMSGVVSNSYTLTNSDFNAIGRNYSGTSEPTKVDTVSQMPTILEIVGDSFKEDTNNINNGYPILNWQ